MLVLSNIKNLKRCVISSGEIIPDFAKTLQVSHIFLVTTDTGMILPYFIGQKLST